MPRIFLCQTISGLIQVKLNFPSDWNKNYKDQKDWSKMYACVKQGTELTLYIHINDQTCKINKLIN